MSGELVILAERRVMVLAESLLTQGTPGYTEEGCWSILSCGVFAPASARWLEGCAQFGSGCGAGHAPPQRRHLFSKPLRFYQRGEGSCAELYGSFRHARCFAPPEKRMRSG